MDSHHNKTTGKKGSSKEGPKNSGSKDGTDGMATSQSGSSRGPVKTSHQPHRRNRSGAQKSKARLRRLNALGQDQPGLCSTTGEGSPMTGTKRPRSEGNTPGSGTDNQSRKKSKGPTQSSYRAVAAADLKVAIISSNPEVTITDPQHKDVITALAAVIDNLEDEPRPRFTLVRWDEQGFIAIHCENQFSLDWLEGTISSIKPWVGANLKVQRHIPRVIKVVAVVHGSVPSDTDTTLKRLQRDVPDLRTNLWRTYCRKVDPKRTMFAFGVDEASFEVLRRQNFRAFAAMYPVTFMARGHSAAPNDGERPTGAASPGTAQPVLGRAVSGGPTSSGNSPAGTLDTAQEAQQTVDDVMASFLEEVSLASDPEMPLSEEKGNTS
mgnify:FL=1